MAVNMTLRVVLILVRKIDRELDIHSFSLWYTGDVNEKTGN